MDGAYLMVLGYLPEISAFFSMLAAVAAVVIAFRGYKTSCLQSRLSMFEQRFDVYKCVEEVILNSSATGMLSYLDASRLSKIKRKSQFLFGEDINTYIDELKNHAVSSGRISDELKDLTIDPEKKSELKKEKTSEEKYRDAQYELLYGRFKPYLNFSLK